MWLHWNCFIDFLAIEFSVSLLWQWQLANIYDPLIYKGVWFNEAWLSVCVVKFLNCVAFEEFVDFGFLLDHWKYYIVNSFIRVNGKRMSNGPMESLNGRLKRILNDGYGYSQFNRFRNRALFSLNKNEPIKLWFGHKKRARLIWVIAL